MSVCVCVCVLEDKVCVLNYPNVISLAMFLRSSPVPQGCVCVCVCVCVCERARAPRSAREDQSSRRILEEIVGVCKYRKIISLAMFLRSSPVPHRCVCVCVCVCVCE